MTEPNQTTDRRTSLEELLQSAARDLRNAFDRAAEVRHRGERGRLRETQVLDFLADRIPQSYSVGTGQLADSQGRVSGQIDGLVFHSASSPRLYTEKGKSAYQPGLYFIESVAATISVKSKLDKKELFDSFNNIASAKMLTKHYAGNTAVIAGDAESSFNQFGARQPPIGVVFAYSSISPRTLVRHVRDFYRDLLVAGQPELWTVLPEFIFVLDSCLIHTPTWYGPSQREDKLPSEFDNLPNLPMISCELDCETNPVMSNFFTDFVERMLDVPILKVRYDQYTRAHIYGPTLMAFPAHTVPGGKDDVLEGSIDVKRVYDSGGDVTADDVEGNSEL